MAEYITSCEGGDGFGAQYQRIISTILYCELTNNKFVYRPFKNMEHNYDNTPNFIEKKENFINLINNFDTIDSVPNYRSLGPRVYEVENNLDDCLKLNSLSSIKKYLHEGKTRPFDEKHINIAVHIRRFNPHDIGDYAYTSDDYYLRVIEYIRNNHQGNKLFHIYSQGENEIFKDFINNDVVLHLNESIEDTFYGMVTSDILVMSKSSLSYSAAMLSDGIVYYLPFWHPPATKWITI